MDEIHSIMSKYLSDDFDDLNQKNNNYQSNLYPQSHITPQVQHISPQKNNQYFSPTKKIDEDNNFKRTFSPSRPDYRNEYPNKDFIHENNLKKSLNPGEFYLNSYNINNNALNSPLKTGDYLNSDNMNYNTRNTQQKIISDAELPKQIPQSPLDTFSGIKRKYKLNPKLDEDIFSAKQQSDEALNRLINVN